MDTPILIKITGELFCHQEDATGQNQHQFSASFVDQVMEQLKELTTMARIGIVIGGGNFFRGSHEGKAWGLDAGAAGSVGMLATVMNGIILKDCLKRHGVTAQLVSALPIPGICDSVNHAALHTVYAHSRCIIFSGGLGVPYFTTDTAAVVRALQMGARTLWKATKTPYVYDKDPHLHKDSMPLPVVSYHMAREKNLHVLDATAFALAEQHGLTIRVFNLFEPEALLNVARNPHVGSTIQ